MTEKWCAIESYELANLVAATAHIAARAALTRRVLTLRFGELGLTVEAANTDLQVTKHFAAETTFTDTRVVPAKLFADVVKALPAGRVLLEPEEEALTVSSGTAKFIIPTPNLELPGFSVEGEPVGAGSQKLVDGINRVAFAASSASEITRSIALTGVHIEPGEPTVFVATDSYRLAIFEDFGLSFDGPNMLVPAGFAAEAVKAGVTVGELSADLNGLQLAGPNGSIVSRLFVGEFPAWRRLLPESFSIKVRVDKAALEAAVVRAGLVVRGSNIPVRLVFDGAGVLVVGQDYNTGESEERVEAEISGEYLEVGYNPGFLLDGLRACRSEQVELGLNDNQRPTIVSGVGDEGFRYVLMPVRF